MRICFVGYFTDNPDEGVRKIASCLAQNLDSRQDVLTINISAWQFLMRLREFRPHVIHFILSPTTLGLIASKAISLACPSAKTVLSAPHPDYIADGRWMSVFKPDMILTQASRSENVFRDIGYCTRFFPNGVDVDRYAPVEADERSSLRKKYNLPAEKFVVLHVASLKRGRNLEVLKELQQLGEDIQVLIIGRESEQRDEALTQELREAGCLVWIEFFPNIEEIYLISDCYIFPTIDRRYAIETPLSVLEAMACNLPVISTRFGALPMMFAEGNGFTFIDDSDELSSVIRRIRNGQMKVETREMVLRYSWQNIVAELESLYSMLINAS